MDSAFRAVIFPIALRAIEMICFAFQSNCCDARRFNSMWRHSDSLCCCCSDDWANASTLMTFTKFSVLRVFACNFCVYVCNSTAFKPKERSAAKAVPQQIDSFTLKAFECLLLTCISGNPYTTKTICSTHRSSRPPRCSPFNRMTFNLCSCKHLALLRWRLCALTADGEWLRSTLSKCNQQNRIVFCFIFPNGFSPFVFYFNSIFLVDAFFHVFSAHSTISVHRSSFCSTIFAMLGLWFLSSDGLHGFYYLHNTDLYDSFACCAGCGPL